MERLKSQVDDHLRERKKLASPGALLTWLDAMSTGRGYRDEIADNVTLDTRSSYMRLSKNETLKESDYLSYWENPTKLSKRPKEWVDIRNWKGWSVFIVNPATNTNLIERWQNRYSNSPQDSSQYVHVIRLHRTTGHVDRSGSRRSPDHRNVWKSDSFDPAKLVMISCLDFQDDV